jgi:hypothetical protein
MLFMMVEDELELQKYVCEVWRWRNTRCSGMGPVLTNLDSGNFRIAPEGDKQTAAAVVRVP